MTSATIRTFFFLLIFLVPTGCTLPAISLSDIRESKLFAEGLDRYITTSDPTTLEQLPLLYPQGEWRARAESILDMADQKSQRQSLLDLRNNELANCQEEQESLIQENKMLEATLNQLKEVLIDTELKAK